MKITIYTKEKVYNFKSDNDKNYDYALEHAHKENGPAFIQYFDNKNIRYEKWYLNGKCHRKNGPAYIEYYKNCKINWESYYLNGKHHRENGPAYINYFENRKIKYKEYYLNDKYYSSKTEFNQEMLKRKLQLI